MSQVQTIPPAGVQGRASAPNWYRLCPWLLLLLGYLLYRQTFAYPFVFDDEQVILKDTLIRSLSHAGSYVRSQRGLVTFTFALNYAFGELNPIGYRVVNVAVHVLGAMALMGVVRRVLLRAPGQRWRGAAESVAFAAALLWLVHPLPTQAVTYVCQRFESMMALFYLLTLYCGVRAMQQGDDGRRSGRVAWSVCAVTACLLGMATKQVMVSAPLMVWVIDRTFFAGGWWTALRRRPLFYAGLAGTWLWLLRLMNYGHDLVAEGASAGFGVKQFDAASYFITQPGVITHYLRLALWPDVLCFDYRWPLATSMQQVVPPGLFIITLLLGTAFALWRRSWLGVVGALFFMVLAPSSSFVPIYDAAVEHRMYLPLAAVVVAVVVLACGLVFAVADRWPSRAGLLNRAALGVLLLVAAALGVRTHVRNGDYRSEKQLWSTVLEVSPENARAYNNLGKAIMQETGDVDRALPMWRRAIELSPRYSAAVTNVGNAYLLKGDAERAQRYLTRAVRLQNPIAQYLLGRALDLSGQTQQAIDAFRKAVETMPTLDLAHNSLGLLLLEGGEYEEAVGCFEEALRLKPDMSVAHLNLGRCQQALGRRADAAGSYARAINHDPKAVDAYLFLAKLLIEERDFAHAHELLLEAVRLEGSRPIAHEMLAVTHAVQGDQQAGQSHRAQAIHLYQAEGIAHARAGQLDDARSKFEAALLISPGDRQTLEHMGTLEGQAGRWDASADFFRRALDAGPESAALRLRLADALARGLRWSAAVQQYEAVTTLEPGNGPARYRFAKALHESGQREQAIQQLQRVVEQNPSAAEPRQTLERWRAE